MLIDRQISSVNTGISMTIPDLASLHASRAACTSAHSPSSACNVFFKSEIPFVQLLPQSTNLDRNALLRQPSL
jgi:hypothetical protein